MNCAESVFARRLLGWYDRSRRDLPWRASLGKLPDPYHILVSETMLQQTQVATVIPYFQRFISVLPTLSALAESDEQAVLRLWQGLGYYSRARNLRKTAQTIMAEHGGKIPTDIATLMRLPGIGRYTAGAVASIAYDCSAPIVDGNVARVLCRLDRIMTDPRDRPTQEVLWRRATQVLPKSRCGDFNSAMMELGATICTPRSPQCLVCPVQRCCEAFSAGVQDRIPPPRKTKPNPRVLRRTFCVRRGTNGDTTWLIEQRPPKGRWAGLWQFVTVEADKSPVDANAVLAATGVKSGIPRRIGIIEHALTHRDYCFEIYLCRGRGGETDSLSGTRKWVRLDELEHYPLPTPHLRIAAMLRSH